MFINNRNLNLRTIDHIDLKLSGIRIQFMQKLCCKFEGNVSAISGNVVSEKMQNLVPKLQETFGMN